MVSPDFVRIGTRLAALEMIESGTTAYADMYYFEEDIAKATKEAGLRGVLGQTMIQFPVADAKTPAEGLARAERFIKAFLGDPLIVPAVAPHALYTLDAASLRAAASSAGGTTRRSSSTSRKPKTKSASHGTNTAARRPGISSRWDSGGLEHWRRTESGRRTRTSRRWPGTASASHTIPKAT